MLQLEERINNFILGVKGLIKMFIMYCFCVLIGEFALIFFCHLVIWMQKKISWSYILYITRNHNWEKGNLYCHWWAINSYRIRISFDGKPWMQITLYTRQHHSSCCICVVHANCLFRIDLLSYFIYQRSVRESCERIGSFLHDICKADEENGRYMNW